MATDIAFAVGVIAMVGPRIPVGVKIFLLTLAIVDDIGAILVIAVFYTEDVALGWLAVALAVIPLVVILQKMRVRSQIPVVILAIIMWVSLLEAGISPTLSGVAMGLLAPAWSFYDPALFAVRARAIVDKVDSRFSDKQLDNIELEKTQSNLADLATEDFVGHSARDDIRVVIPSEAEGRIEESNESFRIYPLKPIT